MQRFQGKPWIIDYENVFYLESHKQETAVTQNILEITTTLTVQNFNISKQPIKLAYPNDNIVIVLQRDYPTYIQDQNASYILKINLQKKQLRCFRFTHPIKSFQVRTPDQIIFINYARWSLDVFSLTNNAVTKRIPLKSKRQENDEAVKLLYFQQTQYVCIAETIEQSLSLITYYDLKAKANEKQLIYFHKVTEPIQQIFKLNRHSKIAWHVSQQQNDCLRFQTFAGYSKTVNFRFSYVFDLYNILPQLRINNQCLKINQMEEIRQHVFYLKVQLTNNEANRERNIENLLFGPPRITFQQYSNLFQPKNTNPKQYLIDWTCLMAQSYYQQSLYDEPQ